ncbi:hypothetical protein EHS25_004709 [Saitozyma podzolica]|uniref:CUE domain-containing protein n=1 Tax=Saitozyma podzolica TaxID=1890683 RepID=A0A427YUT0_9TREE|nr:hypothetical protein EHS25_004709 [Saitozyma podzolica]
MSASPPPKDAVPSPARTPTPTSRSSAAAPVVPVTTAPPPSADPKVAELQVMFPSIDVSVIEIVLESCGGSQDRAIEQLLAMTDPNFKPDELHSARQEEASQLDLDAQFARSLQMQDEEDMRQRQQSGGPPGALPYQPRVRRNRPQGQQTQGQDQSYQPQYEHEQQRDGQNPAGMLMMEEKLGQFAEAAGNTINSFWSKAKSKYSDFQAQQAQRREAEDRAAREAEWEQGQQGGSTWGGGQVPGGNRGGQQNFAQQRGGGLWEDSRSFDSRSESVSSESTFEPPTPAQQTVPLRQSTGRWQPSDAYEDPMPPPRPVSGSPGAREGAGRRSPGVGSPDKATAGKIDPAKLGILPKKRVDLFSTSPSSAPTLANHDDPNPSLPNAKGPESLVSKIPPTPPAENPYKLEDSDDELEYTRNPFDEK